MSRVKLSDLKTKICKSHTLHSTASLQHKAAFFTVHQIPTFQTKLHSQKLRKTPCVFPLSLHLTRCQHFLDSNQGVSLARPDPSLDAPAPASRELSLRRTCNSAGLVRRETRLVLSGLGRVQLTGTCPSHTEPCWDISPYLAGLFHNIQPFISISSLHSINQNLQIVQHFKLHSQAFKVRH